MRRIALVAAVLLALTGCADDDDNAGSRGEASPSASQTAASGTRTVTHERGTTEVPADPERVVVLNSSALDFALSLGVTPVGTVGQDADGSLPEYLQDRVEGIETVGQTDSPNLGRSPRCVRT